MGLSETNKNDLIKFSIEKSDDAFEDAILCINNKRWSIAANRLYYTMFHIVCAMFLKDGNPIKSHRGAKVVLTKNYVLTGILDKKYSTIFAKLETLRDMADYDVTFTATEEEIMKFKPQVEDFINKIKDLIND